MPMSEILMYVVAKAAEPTGTTVTMASDQGDVVSVRFALDEHLCDLYEVGVQTMVTIQPLLIPLHLSAPAIADGHSPLPSAPQDRRT
jgi:hypothetical protein